MAKSVFVLVIFVVLLTYQHAETKPTKNQNSKQQRGAEFEKKITRQLNDFKGRVNHYLLEMSGQILSLVDRVDNLMDNRMQGTVSKDEDQSPGKIEKPHKKARDETDRLNTLDELSKEVNRKYAVLSEAFSSEKQMNRELRRQLAAIQDNISTIYQDIVTNVTSHVQDLVKEAMEEILDKLATKTLIPTKTVPTTTMTDSRPVDCDAVPSSGIYVIGDRFETPVTMFCEKDDDDVGWVVFLRRKDGSENFNRSWADYKNGFGELDGEFWAGNDLLHKLTKSKPATLRIDMEDFDGNKAYAEYDQFQIGSEDEKYKLSVSGYSGTAGDSLIDTIMPHREHNGAKFTTYDSDNDKYFANCAIIYHGGWWFNACFESHLTGTYSKTGYISSWEGVIWFDWTGKLTGLKFAEMKLRLH